MLIEPLVPADVQKLIDHIQREIDAVMTPPLWYERLSTEEQADWYDRAVVQTANMRGQIAEIIRLGSLLAPPRILAR